MERRLEGVTVRLVKGDICDREVDAVVNAANNHLWMGGGVAGAIKRRGGPEIEREAMAQGPIAVGAAVATTAGALKAKHVIHAAVMDQDLSTDAEKIGWATASALDLAKGLGLTSLALPALGTGVGGFSREECARIMLGAVRKHARSGTTLARVEFVLFDQAGYDAFAQALPESEVGDAG
jgi:O-acetyl-ADP-ribose deacetylase (regulator of RNase III)